jgi:hypothetical protein
MTYAHFTGKCVSFQEIVTHLEFHIFTLASTFHRSPICNNFSEIISIMDIAMFFFGDMKMNEIIGATTIYEDNVLPILDIVNQLNF